MKLRRNGQAGQDSQMDRQDRTHKWAGRTGLTNGQAGQDSQMDRQDRTHKWTGRTGLTNCVGYKCYGILVGRLEGNSLLGRPRRRWKRMSEEIFHEGVN